MNNAEFVSHVAAKTSTTKAAVDERMVGAVFDVISDALARDELAAVPASRVVSFKPAKALRDQHIAGWEAVPCSPSASATQPPDVVYAFGTQIGQTSSLASRRHPMLFFAGQRTEVHSHSACFRTFVTGITLNYAPATQCH